MSADGFIVTIFRFIKSLTRIFSKSFVDFLTIAQRMSFSVRIPFSLSPSLMIRLPTRFLTMVLAQSLRFVVGSTKTKFLVMRSPTLIPVSMFVLGGDCLYNFIIILG